MYVVEGVYICTRHKQIIWINKQWSIWDAIISVEND